MGGARRQPIAMLVDDASRNPRQRRVITAPGLAVATPGSGEIIAAPVSVCYQVSTIGVRPVGAVYRLSRRTFDDFEMPVLVGFIGVPS